MLLFAHTAGLTMYEQSYGVVVLHTLQAYHICIIGMQSVQRALQL